MSRILVATMLFTMMNLLSLTNVFAQNSSKGVKYKKNKRIDFESLLIEGESKKPELSVVTGNLGEKDLGLLKLREDFKDMIANDAGEEIQ
jgi:hypothetical protein